MALLHPVFLSLFFGLLLTLAQAGPAIFGVTTNQGSITGGTKLLIHGTGLSSMSNGGVQTLVFIGVDECRVEPYYSTDDLLTCFTSAAPKDQRGIYISGQPLDIMVSNPTQLNTREMYFKGSGSYKFTHSWDRTPFHHWLYTGGAQGKEMKAWGTFKVDAASQYRISIAGSQCAIEEQTYADENDLMDGNGYGVLKCLLGEGMPPGRHNVTIRIDNPSGSPANGLAMRGRRSLQVEPFSQQLYQFTAHPRITRISQVTSGLGGGQEMTIEGTGFSVNPRENQAFVGSQPCNTTFSSPTLIRCTVPRMTAAALASSSPPSSSAALKPASRGLSHRVWHNSGSFSVANGGKPADVATTNTGNLVGLFFNEPGLDNYVQEQSGFFVPPVTADYSFYLMSDDTSQIWVNNNSSNPTAARNVASVTGYRGNTWFGEPSQISAPIRFEANKPYFFRVLHQDGNGGDFLTVGLRVHSKHVTLDGSTNTAVDALKGGVQRAYASLPEVQRIEIRTTVVREQQRLTIAGAATGKMFVFFGQSTTMTSIPLDASVSAFSAALSGYPCSALTVTRDPYNSTTLINPQATGFAYTVTINCPLSAPGLSWPAIKLMSDTLVAAVGIRDVELISTRSRPASAPVSGTFRLGFNDGTNEQVTAPLSFAAPSWVIEGALEALTLVSAVDVEVMGSTTTLLEGGTWSITFHAPNGNIGKLAILTEDDAGFTTLLGESLTTNVVEVQDGSDDPFFSPVSLDFFRTALPSSVEPVTVVSNGILSDCDVFTFNGSVPILNSASNASTSCAFKWEASLTPMLGDVSADRTANGDTAVYAGDSIVIQGSGFLTADSGRLNQVLIGSSPCVITEALSTRLTCTLAAGGPVGVFDVRVLVGSNKGLALPADGSLWPQVRVGMRATDFSPKTGSKAGGTLLEIFGSGFSEGGSNVVAVGTGECRVVFSSPSLLRCITPAAVEQSASTSLAAVTVDGVAIFPGNDTSGNPLPAPSFTYSQANTPVVIAMTPTRVSAGVSAAINLTLLTPQSTSIKSVSFGSRSCRVERVIFSAGSESIVTCTLIRGGVRPLPQSPIAPTVEVDGCGYADAKTNAIALDDSFGVSSMSLSFGSLDGSNVVTFSAVGLSSFDYANEVAFEHVDSWGYRWSTPCEPVALPPSADPTTTLTCTLPSIPDAKRGDPATWTPTSSISGRFVVKTNNVTAPCATATNNCSFTQRIESTPVVTRTEAIADSASPSGLALRLTGERLDLQAGGLSVKVGPYSCSPNVAVSSTSLTCHLPVGPAGKVAITASAGDIGDTRIAPTASSYVFPFVASDFTGPSLGSMAGGSLLRIAGQGFAAGNLSANEVTFVGTSGTPSLPAFVVAATATELLVRSPPHPTLASGASQTFDVFVVNREPSDPALQPIRLASPFTFDYTTTVLAAVRGTPTVTNVSPLTGGMNTLLTITGTNFGNFSMVTSASEAPASVTIGGVPCVISSPFNTSNSDTVLRCTVGPVPAGKHRVLVSRASGYARNSATSTTYFTSTLTVMSVLPRTVSFGGGELIKVSGRGFATVSNAGDAPFGVNQVNLGNRGCTVVNATYTELFCRTTAMLTASALNTFPVFDAAVLRPQTLIPATASSAAAYDGDVSSTFYGCGIVNDLGANSRAIVTAARVFPKFRSASLMANAVFQGSNDSLAWTTLASVGPSILEGWNNVQLVSSPGLAYLASASSPVINVNNGGSFSNGNNTTASLVPSNKLGDLPSYRYLRFSFAPGVTGGNCAGQEVEWQGFVIAAPSPSTNVDGLYPVEVTVNASRSLPTIFGGGASILPVTVSNTTTSDTLVQFSLSATPLIRALSPNNGSSLGGSLITLSGSNLPSSVDGIQELSLNGVPCSPVSASVSAITCVTGPRGNEIQPLSVKLRVKQGGAASATGWVSGEALYNPSEVFFRYLDRWSSLQTWKFQEPPLEGDTVVVPMGQSVLVDISPPRLFLVLVEGELVFDNRDLQFEASYFIAHGGKIAAGSVERPFTNRLKIVLHGERRKAVEIPDLGAKCLVVTSMGMDHDEEDETPEPGTVPSWHSKNAPRKRPSSRASLDLHGIPRKRVWTMLAETASAGSDVLVMSEDVDWTVGETLVVTDNQVVWQSEEVIVAEVLGPRRLRLTAPLKNDHRSWFATGPNGVQIDERAEVMLLSRNIRVQGDDTFSDRDQFGVHIAAMHGDSILRLSNIEITKAGQAGLLGRYPAHFHEIGEYGRDGFIIGNSIHHTYQRGTTVHATNHARVAHNAYFHLLGHSVFVEDGIERFNFFEENLVAWTLPCHVCTNSDFKPSSYWTASPTNSWRHNRAAGSVKFGYWFELPDRPLGPSYRPDYFPKQMPLIEFYNNTAHSNEVMGLRIYPGWNPRVVPGDDSSLALSQYLRQNTFVFNNEGTFHRVVGAVHHVNSVFADNEQAFGWRQLEGGITLHSDNPFVKDSIFVCSTAGPDSCNGRNGMVAPQSEFWYGAGLTFFNYGTTGRPLSGCHSCDSAAFMKQGAFTYRLSRLSFLNTERRVGWNPPYKCIFQDLDGTLTGNLEGSFGVPAGGWAVAPFAFNNFAACPKDRSQYSIFEAGNVCDNSVTVRKVQLDWLSPVELEFQTMNVSSAVGWDLVKFRPREVYGWSFPAVQRTSYNITWTRTPPGLPLSDWQRMRVKWGGDPSYIDAANDALNARAAAASRTVQPAEREWMSLNFTWAFTRFRNAVKYGGWPNGGSLAGKSIERADLATFGAIPGPAHAFGTGSRPGDQSGPLGGLNRTWSVVFTSINTTQPSGNDPANKFTLTAWAEQCAPGGCLDPAAMNLGEATMWSSPSSWPSLGGRLPMEGEDVVINGTSYIVMDINPPKLGRVTIYGRLEFKDSGYRKLEADSVVVWGELAIGSTSSPFLNQADLILHGAWPGNSLSGSGPNAPVVLDNNLFLGNKVLAVLGKFTAVAKPRPVTWTRLNSTAAAGATTISLSESVGGTWLAGDKIVLGATSFDQNSYETATVRGVSGAVVTLDAPLRYNHFAGPAATSGLASAIRLQAAVGLLSRSVRIAANLTSASDTYGVTIAVHGITRTSTSGSTTTKRRIEGQVELRNVEIRNGGKQGLEFPALRLQYGNYLYDQTLVPSNPVNTIDSCSFTDSFNYALLAVSAKHLVLNRTVFHNSFRNGVDLDAQSWNATVEGNLLVGNRKSPDVNAADQLQWIQPQSAFLVSSWASTFKNNVVSGAFDAAFTFRVPECSTAAERYSNNEAAGVRIGAFLLPTATVSSCVKLSRFTVWKASHLGVVSVDQVSNVEIEGLISVENAIGISINYFGSKLPAGVAVGKITSSSFIGSTPLLSPSCSDSVCRAASESDPDGSRCGSALGSGYRRAGILLPAYYNRGKTCDQDDELPVCSKPNYVSRLCSLPWEQRYGTIGKYDVQLQLTDVRFGGFALSECGGKRSSAIVHNPLSIDMSTPVYARQITWDANQAVESRFHFAINEQTDEKCQGGIGCDGLGFVYLLDLDGSLLGRGSQATLIGNNPLAALPSPACQSFPSWSGIVCSPAVTLRKAYLEGVEVGRIAMGLLQHTRLTSELENRTTMSVGSFKEECSMIGGQPWYGHFLQPGVDSALFFPATEPSAIRPYSWDVFVGQDGTTPGKDLSSLSSASVTRYPLRTDEPGSFLFVPGEKKLYFTVRPGRAVVYTLVRKPSVQLNVNLKISVEDFYNAKGAFLESLSILLNIPSWRIKIVDVRAGSAAVRVEISDEHPTVVIPANVTTAAGASNAGGGTDAIPEDIKIRAEAQISRLNGIVAKLAELAQGGLLQQIGGISVSALSLIPPTSALVAATSPSQSNDNGGAPVTVLTPAASSSGNNAATSSLGGGSIAAIVVGCFAAAAIAVGGFVISRRGSQATARGRRSARSDASAPAFSSRNPGALVPGLMRVASNRGSNRHLPIPSEDDSAAAQKGSSPSTRIEVKPLQAPKGKLAFANRSPSASSSPRSLPQFTHVSPLAARWEERHQPLTNGHQLNYYRTASQNKVGATANATAAAASAASLASAASSAAASASASGSASTSVLGNNDRLIAPARNDVSRTGSLRARYVPLAKKSFHEGRSRGEEEGEQLELVPRPVLETSVLPGPVAHPNALLSSRSSRSAGRGSARAIDAGADGDGDGGGDGDLGAGGTQSRPLPPSPLLAALSSSNR